MRKPVRVLIADDHQVVREGLQMILAESDGEIVVVGEASNGDEAVRLAKALTPDAGGRYRVARSHPDELCGW
jgi:YesN/AraC family two-component response regulator